MRPSSLRDRVAPATLVPWLALEPAAGTSGLNRYRSIRLAALLLLAVLAAACGEPSDLRIARRILENHRRRAGVKPLPSAQIVRLKLSGPGASEGSRGN